MSTETKPRLFGLLHRRQVTVPTRRGWCVLLLVIAVLGLVWMSRIHGFLAQNHPQQARVLVVEGWANELTLEHVVAEFRTNRYEKMYVTGGPLLQGAPLSEYKTYAELGTATLLKLGLSSNVVQAVPAPWVAQDRTYTSAVTLERWFRDHGGLPRSLNLLTEGPHARRSRLMFEKALGKEVTVGIIASPPYDYDPDRWWRSSQGFRAVADETIAYLYARLFFHEGGE